MNAIQCMLQNQLLGYSHYTIFYYLMLLLHVVFEKILFRIQYISTCCKCCAWVGHIGIFRKAPAAAAAAEL